MYELKKMERYLRVNLLEPDPRLMKKKNLPGRGLTKVEKHWSRGLKHTESRINSLAYFIALSNESWIHSVHIPSTFCPHFVHNLSTFRPHVSHYHFPISWPTFTKPDTTVMSMGATRISWFLIHYSQNTPDTWNETSTIQVALGLKWCTVVTYFFPSRMKNCEMAAAWHPCLSCS